MFLFNSHDGSIGRLYICLHEWLIFMGFHVGKYTVRPMDPMGLGDFRFQPLICPGRFQEVDRDTPVR